MSKDVGIEKIIIPGVTLEDTPKIINLIEKYIIYTVLLLFILPKLKTGRKVIMKSLRLTLRTKKIVAIGETGLDYYWDKSFVDLQKHVFRKHLELAQELNLPVIVHDREAHLDVLNILKEYSQEEGTSSNLPDRQSRSSGFPLPLRKGVMHCFSGSAEFALDCVKIGYYIALGGPVTFQNAKKPKEVAQKVPIEMLVLETDSPFLTPHPFRGKRNDPSKIILVAEAIAEIKNLSAEEVAEITSQNAEKLFKI